MIYLKDRPGGGDWHVIANTTVRQSPCAEGEPPDVPKGTRGTVEDVDMCDADEPEDVSMFVDFGDPYGVVLASAEELDPT